MIKLGFTGTQVGMNENQREQLYIWMKEHQTNIDYIYHGGCVGADKQFDDMARALRLGFWITIYPSNILEKQAPFSNAKFGHAPLPPLVRNKIIVALSNILLVAPMGMKEILRSGTWSTVRYMRALKRQIVIFYPDGSVVPEGGDIAART